MRMYRRHTRERGLVEEDRQVTRTDQMHTHERGLVEQQRKMGNKEADRMSSNAHMTLLTMRRHSRGGCFSDPLHSCGKGGIEGRLGTSQPGARGSEF